MASPDDLTSIREVGAVGAGASEQSAEPRTGVRQLLGLSVIALVVAGALVVSSLSSSDSPPLPGPVGGASAGVSRGAHPPSERDALARAALQRQERSLRTDARRAYLRTWDSKHMAARRRAGNVYANLAALRATVSNTRYVAADIGGLTLQQQRHLGGASWTAEVQVSWRLVGFDDRDALATLRYTFVQRGEQAYVVDIDAAAGARRPVWLLGRLVVRRTERTLVVAVPPGQIARIDRRLHQAAVDVASVVSGWRGGLVAYIPADVSQMEAVLGATPGAYSTIAAVTTTVDGSREADAPVAIVINPVVFGRLGPVGAHVVITHESTHAATGAAAVDLPLWVAEGFADYVGVGSVDVPLSVSAGAVIRDIRRNGLPDALPSDAAFGSGQGNLEVYYEQAWLAAQLIAQEYGEARLLAFYERVVAAPDQVGTALRAELGTTRAELTEQWRRYLKAIASAV